LGCSRIGVALRRGHIDSTRYDTTSILKLITVRFGLEPLPGVREGMGDLTAAWPRRAPAHATSGWLYAWSRRGFRLM